MIPQSRVLIYITSIVIFISVGNSQEVNQNFTVHYFLYNKQTSSNGAHLSAENEPTFRQKFNPENPTRFLTHGWQGNRFDPDITLILEAYQNRTENFNIIVTDWSEGADRNYSDARLATVEAGKQVASLIDLLHDAYNLDLDNTYLIGHSLGAHVFGIAGKHVTTGKINTIFGLDPAGPLYFVWDTKTRLTRGDAKYVETIHTDGSHKGFLTPIGNTSFYVNYGKYQPGCTDLSGTCSHARAFEYFAESLDVPNEFYAEQCASFLGIFLNYCRPTGQIAKMGGDPSNYGRCVRGNYYLPTRSESPYALGTSWLDKNSFSDSN